MTPRLLDQPPQRRDRAGQPQRRIGGQRRLHRWAAQPTGDRGQRRPAVLVQLRHELARHGRHQRRECQPELHPRLRARGIGGRAADQRADATSDDRRPHHRGHRSRAPARNRAQPAGKARRTRSERSTPAKSRWPATAWARTSTKRIQARTGRTISGRLRARPDRHGQGPCNRVRLRYDLTAGRPCHRTVLALASMPAVVKQRTRTPN